MIASMSKTLLRVLAVCIVLTVPSVAFSAGPEIFLLEEPESYLVIDKLEGLGILPGLMTGDRGLEAREVAREAQKSYGTTDPFEDGMLRFLILGAENRYDFRVRASLESSGDGRVPPNAQGFPVPKDGGVRLGGFFRAVPLDWAALQGRGDFLAGFDGDTIGRVEETSLRLGFPQATLEAGRFSLWWGPGRHGSLLFTTNAEPLNGVRIRNPRPILPGWWFRFLGSLQYDFFVARLEGDRPIPHSILSGARVAVKPTSWLELGASRALHFGGEGMDESLSTFFDIFRGKSESSGNTPEGNSLASVDAKVRLPFRRQPVILYVEGGGEDQSGSGVPSRWAWMGGVFLPSLGAMKKADLRIEFADNKEFNPSHPGVWYRHSQYPHRYRGQILGHHMGTDARDLFLEAHYFLLPSSYLELNVDITQRSFPGPEREGSWRVSGAIIAWLTENFRAEGRLVYESISNENGVAGKDATDAVFQAALSYQYR
ncbi:MAG: capsule assembly Wzi family protein [Candidatus Deferrimicrobiaceae bacterium]